MSVKLQSLPKPDLKNVKMNCDEIIHHKLTKYPMVEEAFSTSSFNVICGRMGQGKTSLITSWVKNGEIFKKVFNRIYVFMPENSRASIENDIYGKYLPSDQLYETLSEENLMEVYDRLKESSADKEFSLLIIDDFQAQMKEPRVVKALEKIITKMRHLRTTIFLLQQNWIALERKLRNLVSNIIFFNIGKVQLDNIFLEVVQVTKEKYEKIVDLAFTDPHDWVLVNLHKHRGIYRNFDKIIIDDHNI